MSVSLHVCLPAGQRVAVEALASDLVSSLKQQVALESNLVQDSFSLLFDSAVLDEDARVGELPFEDGSELEVLFDKKLAAMAKLKSLGYIGDKSSLTHILRDKLETETDAGFRDILMAVIDSELCFDDYDNLLLTAAQGGFPSSVELLIDSTDANLNAGKKAKPIHLAAKRGALAVVRLLVDRGACPNTVDNVLQVPLHYASAHGHIPVVQFLLQSGADPSRKNSFGNTPLQFSEDSGSHELSTILELWGQ